MHTNYPKDKTHYRTGLVSGLTYDYQFRNNFSLGTGIVYNQRGYSWDFILSPAYTGEPNDLIFSYKVHRDFITVPLKIGFNYGKNYLVYANIGLTPSVLVEAYDVHPKFDFNGNDIPEMTFWNKEVVYKMDIGGLVELGGGYKFTNRFWLNTAFVYQHSFTSILNYDRYPDKDIIHYGFSLSLGIKYALARE